MKLFAILLLATTTASAAETCPVMPVGFYPLWGDHLTEVYIQWKNVSQKEATGITFKAYYTSVGEKIDMYSEYDYNFPPKGVRHPFDKMNSTWDEYQSRTRTGGVWVKRVMFKDGSSWQDDGSRSCLFEQKTGND